MARRRDYISFFGGGRRRREDIFHGGPARRGTLRFVPVVLVAFGLLFAIWWFFIRSTSPPLAIPQRRETTQPSVLTRLEASTTTVGRAVPLECADVSGDWATFQGSASRTGCSVAPQITQPRILWQADVGVQGWLNNPVIVDGTVYVGSAGTLQFEPDAGDGVYAFDLRTGQRKWFFASAVDVNGVGFGDSVLVATGDEGRVWGLNPESGRPLWTSEVGNSVFTNPLVIQGLAIVGDAAGRVTAYDITTGERSWVVTVRGAVRGGVASDGTRIYVAGDAAEVAAITLDGAVAWRRTVQARGPNRHGHEDLRGSDAGREPRGALTGTRRRLYPAGHRGARQGNRKRPVASDRRGRNQAGMGECAVESRRGGRSDRLWGVVLGRPRGHRHPQWRDTMGRDCRTILLPALPSPVVVGGQVIIPRHDGGIYGVDMATGSLTWSLYLGSIDRRGAFPATYGPGFCDWGPETGYSVLSSPAVAENGIVIVGTLEGMLVALGDVGWRL